QICEVNGTVEVIAYPELTGFRPFCFDHDDAVGSLGSVDRSCGSILQNRNDGNAIDVKDVDHTERRIVSIQDEKWLIGIIFILLSQSDHTGLAPDFNIRKGVRIRSKLIIINNGKSRV